MNHSTRKIVSLAAFAAAFWAVPHALHSQQLFWDMNGSTGGAGGSTPAGTWDVGTTNWNPLADGTGGVQAWAGGDEAMFSAGTDATGAYTVTIAGIQSVSGLTFQEGNVTFAGGVTNGTDFGASAGVINVASGRTITFGTTISDSARLTKSGSGTIVLNVNNTLPAGIQISGGVVRIPSIASASQASTLGVAPPSGPVSDYIILDGGALWQTNTGNGATFVQANRGITLTANGGSVGSVDNPDHTSSQNVAYAGTVSLAPSVTSATLFKVGDGEFRAGAAGWANTKLEIKSGFWRASVAPGTADTALGAVPGSYDPSALRFNGAGTTRATGGAAAGTSAVMVTPPTRGVTVEANGATFITNAQWTIQSIITGPGGITLNENGWNPTTATSGFALVLTGSNTYLGATKINDGALNIQGGFAIPDASAVTIAAASSNSTPVETRAVLIVTNAETIGSLAGGSPSYGTVSLSQSLTTGANNTSTQFDGLIAGAGALIKTGSGKFTVTAANTYLGGTTINGGTVAVSSDGNLGDASTGVTLDGGAVQFTAAVNSARTFTVNAGNGSIDASAGASTLTSSPTGAGTLHKTGSADLTVKSILTSGLSVDQGKLIIPAGQNTANTSSVQSLSVAGGATLDMNDQDLVADSSGTTLTALQNLLASGYNNGGWNGTGIASTVAANTDAVPGAHLVALGYGANSVLGFGPTFSGVPVSGTSLLIRYTLAGDANLDGTVDTVDFNNLAGNFSQGGKFWTDGDFNFDGVVDSVDFNILASNFSLTLSAPSGNLGTLVPEPSCAAILGLCAAALLARKRRAQLFSGGPRAALLLAQACLNTQGSAVRMQQTIERISRFGMT